MFDYNVEDNRPDQEGLETFIKVAGATMAGAYIGHKIDQTRFGIWFNNNRTINAVWKLAGIVLCCYLVYLAILFVVCLVNAF